VAEVKYQRYVGIDWATESHEVTVLDGEGEVLSKRAVEHSGAAIATFVDWLLELSGGDPSKVAVGIEVPRGALVETLVDRGVAVYSINPKQLDRFRDRHTVAGAKDDSRDSHVIGDSLRTDRHCFRRVKLDDELIIELREFSRVDEDLKQELSRLSNRLREQIYRFFPQMLRLCPAANESWFWDLIELIPTPAAAQEARPVRVSKLLRGHRIRRLSADEILAELRTRPVHVAPGTTAAATAHIKLLLPRLRLVQSQVKQTQKRIAELLDQLSSAPPEGQKNEHRDAEIILSMKGIGIIVAATMLGEAAQAIAERDYDYLRANAGVAPVTRQSGKRKLVLRRYACNPRLSNAVFQAARVHAQCDPYGRELYAALRQRGHSHGRALRTIGDRLLRILIAMLRTGTLYDPTRPRTGGVHPGANTALSSQRAA
jgi:transposase